jgi:glyoxylate/hydroxypyruvate reductase A
VALVFHCLWDHAVSLREGLVRLLPDVDIRVWPDVGNPDEIEFAVVWNMPHGELAKYRNLKAILSPGAGVDHLFADPDLPKAVPIARLTDPRMADRMAEYVATLVLWAHRRFDAYADQQRACVWAPVEQKDAHDRRVGILGLGYLGQAAARRLRPFGFAMRGWSRTPKDEPGVESFHGPNQLDAFFDGLDIVACLLPLTPETRGILGAGAFARMAPGGYVINAARGAHVVVADLISALDSGHLSGAGLDVFEAEPLPPGSPLWSHPRVRVTPHVSSLTVAESAAPMLAAQVRRVQRGESPENVVDPAVGY